MVESKLSWAFLTAALLAVGWGLWLKLHEPAEPEKVIEWVRLPTGQLVQGETREPFEGVREIPFELSPDIVEWEFTYVGGFRNGPAKGYYLDPVKKRLKSSATYVAGLRQGLVIAYHQKGLVESKANAVDDLIHGIVTKYDIDGLVTERKVVEQGFPSNESVIIESPQLITEPDPAELDSAEPEEEISDIVRMLDSEGNPFTGTQTGTFWGGKEAFERSYKDGLLHGADEGWDTEGKPEYTRGYFEGKKHKQWQQWGEGGKLIIEETFHHGLQIGAAKRWHPNGQVRQETNFVHGAEDGVRKIFGRGGRPRRETTFDHGRQTHLIEWNIDGSINIEESTPLQLGLSASIPPSEEAVSQIIELKDFLAEEEEQLTIGFRYRLSIKNPEPPASAARPFRVSLVQNDAITTFFDFEGELGGWRFNAWGVEFVPGETLTLQIDAEPGELQIEIAGVQEIVDEFAFSEPAVEE